MTTAAAERSSPRGIFEAHHVCIDDAVQASLSSFLRRVLGDEGANIATDVHDLRPEPPSPLLPFLIQPPGKRYRPLPGIESVTPQWVLASLLARRALSSDGFSPSVDKAPLSGQLFSFALLATHSRAICGPIVRHLGGRVTTKLTTRATHLVVEDQGEIPVEAEPMVRGQRRPECTDLEWQARTWLWSLAFKGRAPDDRSAFEPRGPSIVCLHWLGMCFTAFCRHDEACSLTPVLTKAGPECGPELEWEGCGGLTEEGDDEETCMWRLEEGRIITEPVERALVGVDVLLHDTLKGADRRRAARMVQGMGGGLAAQGEITIRGFGERVPDAVGIVYLEALWQTGPTQLSVKNSHPLLEATLTQPRQLGGVPGMEKCVVTCTGFTSATRPSRRFLSWVLRALGVCQMGPMLPGFTTHLICSSRSGAKYEKAIKHLSQLPTTDNKHVYVVSADWAIQSLLAWRHLPEADFAEIQDPAGTCMASPSPIGLPPTPVKQHATGLFGGGGGSGPLSAIRQSSQTQPFVSILEDDHSPLAHAARALFTPSSRGGTRTSMTSTRASLTSTVASSGGSGTVTSTASLSSTVKMDAEEEEGDHEVGGGGSPDLLLEECDVDDDGGDELMREGAGVTVGGEHALATVSMDGFVMEVTTAASGMTEVEGGGGNGEEQSVGGLTEASKAGAPEVKSVLARTSATLREDTSAASASGQGWRDGESSVTLSTDSIVQETAWVDSQLAEEVVTGGAGAGVDAAEEDTLQDVQGVRGLEVSSRAVRSADEHDVTVREGDECTVADTTANGGGSLQAICVNEGGRVTGEVVQEERLSATEAVDVTVIDEGAIGQEAACDSGCSGDAAAAGGGGDDASSRRVRGRNKSDGAAKAAAPLNERGDRQVPANRSKLRKPSTRVAPEKEAPLQAVVHELQQPQPPASQAMEVVLVGRQQGGRHHAGQRRSGSGKLGLARVSDQQKPARETVGLPAQPPRPQQDEVSVREDTTEESQRANSTKGGVRGRRGSQPSSRRSSTRRPPTRSMTQTQTDPEGDSADVTVSDLDVFAATMTVDEGGVVVGERAVIREEGAMAPNEVIKPKPRGRKRKGVVNERAVEGKEEENEPPLAQISQGYSMPSDDGPMKSDHGPHQSLLAIAAAASRKRRFLFGRPHGDDGTQLAKQISIVESLGGEVCRGAEDSFDMSCTHVVLFQFTRTLKYLCGCLAGKWILRPEYLNACAAAGAFVAEGDYEWGAQGESTSNTWEGSCRKWRTAVAAGQERVMHGRKVYVYGKSDKLQPPRRAMTHMLTVAGAEVLTSLPDGPPTAQTLVISHSSCTPDKHIKGWVAAGGVCVSTTFLLDIVSLREPQDPKCYFLFGSKPPAPVIAELKALGSGEAPRAGKSCKVGGSRRAAEEPTKRRRTGGKSER